MQKGFEAISPKELENVISLIGDDWMLITARDEAQDRVNAMTASWGCMGVLWKKPICVCFIRPQRHTFALAEQNNRLSFAFLDNAYRDALNLCGSRSGRDMDKLAAAGLHTFELDGVPVIEEAKLLLIGRKLYADDLKKESFLDPTLLSNYKNDDFHRVYVLEIQGAYRKRTE